MTDHVPASSLHSSGAVSGVEAARLQAEARLHVESRHRVVRVVAGASAGTEDARMLLDMLGLNSDDIRAARVSHHAAVNVA